MAPPGMPAQKTRRQEVGEDTGQPTFGEPIGLMNELAWMSSQAPVMHNLLGKRAKASTSSSTSRSTPNAPAPTQFPAVTVAYATTSSGALTSNSKATSKSTPKASTSHTRAHPQATPTPLDTLARTLHSHIDTAVRSVDERIIRHILKGGGHITTMKARATELGYRVDREGRLIGTPRAKGDQRREQLPFEAMEVDAPQAPAAKKVLPVPREDPPPYATGLPTPAPSRSSSMLSTISKATPAHAPPRTTEPQAKRRRIDSDENTRITTPDAVPPPSQAQVPHSLSQTSGRKQLGMRPARRAVSEKPDPLTDRAHPRPFRPPLRASQNANSVQQTTHPPPKQETMRAKQGRSPVKQGRPPTKQARSQVKQSSKARAMEEDVVLDSEDEDEPMLMTRPPAKREEERHSSPAPADADSSFDWDGAGLGMDAAFLQALDAQKLP